MTVQNHSLPGAPTESGVLQNVPIRVTFDPAYQQGHLHLTMEAATFSIDDKEVGSILFCIGGGLELHDDRTKKSWYLGLNEIWSAFEVMLAEQAKNAEKPSSAPEPGCTLESPNTTQNETNHEGI